MRWIYISTEHRIPRHFVEGLMCSRVPTSNKNTTHHCSGKIPSSREKELNPKNPHGRTHTTDADTSSASAKITRDTIDLVRRAISTYHHIVRSTQIVVLAINGFVTRLVRGILLPTRRKSWRSRCLIHLGKLSFIRVLGEENGVLTPLNRQGHRDRRPR